jgi:ribulose-bisphosphate carboxylase small chain
MIRTLVTTTGKCGVFLYSISAILFEVNMAKKAKPNYYVKLAAFDNTRGTESCCSSFIVQRPAYEPGFRLVRQEVEGRRLVYTIEAYAPMMKPEGERY